MQPLKPIRETQSIAKVVNATIATAAVSVMTFNGFDNTGDIGKIFTIAFGVLTVIFEFTTGGAPVVPSAVGIDATTFVTDSLAAAGSKAAIDAQGFQFACVRVNGVLTMTATTAGAGTIAITDNTAHITETTTAGADATGTTLAEVIVPRACYEVTVGIGWAPDSLPAEFPVIALTREGRERCHILPGVGVVSPTPTVVVENTTLMLEMEGTVKLEVTTQSSVDSAYLVKLLLTPVEGWC